MISTLLGNVFPCREPLKIQKVKSIVLLHIGEPYHYDICVYRLDAAFSYGTSFYLPIIVLNNVNISTLLGNVFPCREPSKDSKSQINSTTSYM